MRRGLRKGRKEDKVITKNVYPLNFDTPLIQDGGTSLMVRIGYTDTNMFFIYYYGEPLIIPNSLCKVRNVPIFAFSVEIKMQN